MIREIKSTAHIKHADFLTESSCVLDIETDSRFWRTSHFKNVRLADTKRELIWIPEKESDEYDLLIDLAESLSSYSSVLTFNGTGFDIPHLRKKYSAYRLSDPFQDMRHEDLFLILRKYSALLPMARHRLNDYMSLMKDSRIPEGDAQKALFISGILNLSCLTAGEFSARICNSAGLSDSGFSSPDRNSACSSDSDFSAHICNSADHTDTDFADRASELLRPEKEDQKEERENIPFDETLTLLLTPALPVFFRVSCTDGPFELHSNPDSGTLELRIQSDGGFFRMYHSDYANYDYLPGEGCAVHRSLTAYVASDRKIKASRENCYTLVPCKSILQGNEKTLIKYSRKAVEYLLARPS